MTTVTRYFVTCVCLCLPTRDYKYLAKPPMAPKHAIYAHATWKRVQNAASIPRMADFSRLPRGLRPRGRPKASD